MTIPNKDEKEAAYLYDLILVPHWRERFDSLVDDTLKLPENGAFADIGCGTGAYAIELAVRGGKDVTVTGVEHNSAMRLIAQGKAEMQKVSRVSFQAGELSDSGLQEEGFALVLADASLASVDELAAVFDEVAFVAAKGATVAVKLTTRGSFDEFFSVLWETLYELDLLEHTAEIERLSTARLTLTDVETLAKGADLKQLKCETRKEIFSYADGKTFMNDPLVRSYFLDEWLAFLPDADTRKRVEEKLVEMIDRAREDLDFEVSIKATLACAQK